MLENAVTRVLVVGSALFLKWIDATQERLCARAKAGLVRVDDIVRANAWCRKSQLGTRSLSIFKFSAGNAHSEWKVKLDNFTNEDLF